MNTLITQMRAAAEHLDAASRILGSVDLDPEAIELANRLRDTNTAFEKKLEKIVVYLADITLALWQKSPKVMEEIRICPSNELSYRNKYLEITTLASDHDGNQMYLWYSSPSPSRASALHICYKGNGGIWSTSLYAHHRKIDLLEYCENLARRLQVRIESMQKNTVKEQLQATLVELDALVRAFEQ